MFKPTTEIDMSTLRNSTYKITSGAHFGFKMLVTN